MVRKHDFRLLRTFKTTFLFYLKCMKGFDTAGPLFTVPFIVALDKRLDSTDATFVQIIHTAATSYGTHICMGDADFWANDGAMEPGCFQNPIAALTNSELWNVGSFS